MHTAQNHMYKKTLRSNHYLVLNCVIPHRAKWCSRPARSHAHRRLIPHASTYPANIFFCFSEQVSASNPASLFVGARLMRHYRFIGEIWNIIFFNEVITPEFVSQLQMDYPMLLEPVGSCVPYLTLGTTCPTLSTEPSLLCSPTSQT